MIAPVPPAVTATMPPSVMVPLVVIGPPEVLSPVAPPETLTLVTPPPEGPGGPEGPVGPAGPWGPCKPPVPSGLVIPVSSLVISQTEQISSMVGSEAATPK